MISKIIFSLLAICSISTVHSHLYNNPYYKFFRYNVPYYNNYGSYANQLSGYSSAYSSNPQDAIADPVASAYLSTPDVLPPLSVLAEAPYSIGNQFTVVPMLVVAGDNMKTITNAAIMSVSKRRPYITVRTVQNALVQCTPAVRIVLDQPITVYSLKSTIVFPAQISIVHGLYRVPIQVGAVIAPISQNTFVSADTPALITVVYAIPTRPITLDYINNNDAIDFPDTQAVVVESEPDLAPANVTVIDFPEQEAEPVLQVDEDDDELVNRNPPQVLAPAGIVQSTQPLSHVEPFSNSKESAVLIALREEAKKRI